MNHVALITGGSNGMGYCLAREFAKQGFNILIVSENGAENDDAVAKIKKDFPVQATSMLIAVILGLVVGISGYFLAGPVLRAMGTKDEIMGATSGAGYIYPSKTIYDAGYTNGFVSKADYAKLTDDLKAKSLISADQGTYPKAVDAMMTGTLDAVCGFMDIRYGSAYVQADSKYKGSEKLFTDTYTVAITDPIMIGKLDADQIDEADLDSLEALDACGANKQQRIHLAVMPQAMPSFVSVALYRFDINIRTATTLGLIIEQNAGIGFNILLDYNSLALSKLGADTIGIVIMIIIVDITSSWLRKKLV